MGRTANSLSCRNVPSAANPAQWSWDPQQPSAQQQSPTELSCSVHGRCCLHLEYEICQFCSQLESSVLDCSLQKTGRQVPTLSCFKLGGWGHCGKPEKTVSEFEHQSGSLVDATIALWIRWNFLSPLTCTSGTNRELCGDGPSLRSWSIITGTATRVKFAVEICAQHWEIEACLTLPNQC